MVKDMMTVNLNYTNALYPSFVPLECHLIFDPSSDVAHEAEEIVDRKLGLERYSGPRPSVGQIRGGITENALFEDILHASAHPLTNILPPHMQNPPTEREEFVLSFLAETFPLIEFIRTREITATP